jgi:hypothetical protein
MQSMVAAVDEVEYDCEINKKGRGVIDAIVQAAAGSLISPILTTLELATVSRLFSLTILCTKDTGS